MYFTDCGALFGSVFPHDDSVNDRTPGLKLDTNWRRTQVRIARARVSTSVSVQKKGLCPAAAMPDCTPGLKLDINWRCTKARRKNTVLSVQLLCRCRSPYASDLHVQAVRCQMHGNLLQTGCAGAVVGDVWRATAGGRRYVAGPAAARLGLRAAACARCKTVFAGS